MSQKNSNAADISDNQLWKTILSGVDAYKNTSQNAIIDQANFYHATLAFKFNGVKWNSNLYTNASKKEYDLYSYVLREAVHALGFSSLLSNNGNSKLGTNFNYYTRFDTFLKNANSQNLITNNGCNSLNGYTFSGTINNLHNNCAAPLNFSACTTAVKFVGTSNLELYTPNCYNNGNSLNLLNENCNPISNYYLMQSNFGKGTTKRHLSNEERNVLNDIGYSFNSSYGTISNLSYVNYNQNLLGNKVAGVNDGFAVDGSFLFKGYTNETFQITNLLSNDSDGGNLSFECLKDLSHSNTSFNLVFGDNTTVIEMNTDESGYHLLSYVPYNNITGKRGNITYILVYIVNNCATLPTDCNLVFNGDFEQFSQLPDNITQIERACNWESFRASPDYFNRNALHPPGSFSVDIPNNAFGSQNVLTPPGGNGYAGLAISRFATNSFFYESFGTRLVTPLQDNTEYQLTFNVSRADNYPGVTRMQAYIGNNLTYTSQNSIAIEPNGILLTNPTFNSTATGWDTLTFTFTTGNTAGQTHLYLGGFNGVFYFGAAVVQQTYYYIDNVRLTPPTEVFNPTFDLVENICSNSAPINLSQLYANNSIDTFSGTGVELIGNEYFFNPNLAGIGSHVITFNTFSPLGCVSTILSDTIEVISCQPPYISQVFNGGTKTKALEVKNASNTQAIAPGSYYLVYYEGNGVPANLAMPTASIDLATGGDILANGVKVFRTAAFLTPNYVTTLPNNQIFNFNGYDGIYDVIIISTSNGADAYNDRIDVLGDNTANNILFKDYTQESYKSLVRMSCTPMGFPRVDYDEQDWVGFNRFGISTVGTYDDSFEVAQGTLTNGELGRHFTDELRWEFSGWNDLGLLDPLESNPDRSRQTSVFANYNTGTNGSFEACSLFVNQLTTLTIAASTNVKVQTSVTIDPNFGRLIVENEGSLVMVRDCYYTPTEGFGCGTELVNLGTNSVLTATKQTVNLSGPYDYVYLSSPLSNNTANPKLNQIFNFGSGTGMFNPNRFYLFQNDKFCDIYKRFSTIVGDVDGYDDNYDDYDPSDTALEQNALMIPGRGYATWPPVPAATDLNYTITFTGEMNNGIVEVPVFKNNSLSGRNANLIGNPYPSAIDLDKFFAENNTVIEPIAYIWTRVTTPDDPNSTYQGPNGLNYTAANYSVYTQDMSLNIENNAVFAGGSILASGQSFFVRSYKDFSGFANAPIAAEVAPVNPATIHPQEEIITAGNIQFRNYMRTTEPNITFSRMESSRANQTNTNPITGDKLWVNLTDANDFTAQIGIYFKPSGNTGYLPTEDAVTIAGRKYNFYTQSTTEDLLIDVQDGFETSKVIPLGITNITGQNQQFTISIPKKGGVFNSETVYLEDTQLGIVHNLSQSSYSFTSLETIIENRFNLLFSNNVSVSKHKKEESLVKVWISNDKVLKVVSEKNNISSIQVFDIYSMNTDALKHNSININQKEFSLPLNEGTKLYSIRITLEDGTIINKKVAK